MISAGALRHRVVIEQKSVTRHPTLGSEVVSWVELATVWARVADVRETARGGDERATADQRIVQARTVVTVRYRDDITTDMRLRWAVRSRTLQIVSKAEVGYRELLELACEEFSA